MGALYEILSTPVAYATPAYYRRHQPARTYAPVSIPFGPDRLQHCVLWEPAEVRHDTVVLWFHGGAYLVGTPESMSDAADVYNVMGYRFVSMGFRLTPHDPFPAQVDDAFAGYAAVLAWLRENGRPCSKVVVGGSSCGGHLAALLAYGRELQERHEVDASPISGMSSCAGILFADDMLRDPFPSLGLWRRFNDLPEAGDRPTWDSVHQALVPYSPIDLIDEKSLVPFFAVHGRSDKMSPYAHQVEFAERLRKVTGRDDIAQIHTVENATWQHMITTVTLHRRRVESNPALTALFTWLGRF